MTILYQLKSRERWVIRNNSAVWSGFDPCPVNFVHMKSSLVTTDLVPNYFSPVHDDCRGTALAAVCRGNAPVKDVVPVGRTGEHSGAAVITSSNINFCQRKYDCVILSCTWIDIMNQIRQIQMSFLWNSKKKNRTFDCCKKES